LRQSNWESITMVDHTPRYRSYDPDIDPCDEDLTDRRVTPYKFGQSARTDYPEDSVPLFLSDYDGEPDPSEYITPVTPAWKDRRPSVLSPILAGVVATAAIAILVALFSSDATRDIIAKAKASSAAVLSAASATVQPNPAQLTARDIQLKDPAQLKDPTRPSASANQTPGVRSVTAVIVTPTREEITTAYQSALQSAPAAAAPVASVRVASAVPVAAAPVVAPPVADPSARKLDGDELATLFNRAKGLLAAGDIPSARLLLERAADAQEPSAALMLARTYDPEVLGTQDARNIIPDPAMARAWYQKAAQFGSADARRRLAEMQN
jgi:TPR repeat protein